MTKADTKFLRGVAVLLLIWHHLFCNWYIETFCFFPECVKGIAWFGRICVAMFSFLTGYGLCRKYEQIQEFDFKGGTYKYIKTTVVGLAKFMIGFWIAFAVFVPIYMVFSGDTFNMKLLFEGFTGKHSELIFSQWWYVSLYIKLLLIIPIICYLIFVTNRALCKYINNPNLRLMIRIFFCIFIWAFTYSYDDFRVEISIAVQGVIFSEAKIFEKLGEKIEKFEWYKKMGYFLVGIALVVFSYIWRVGIMSGPGDSNEDYIIVNIFVVGVFILYKLRFVNIEENIGRICSWMREGVNLMGGHALYLWLVHPVLLYYLIPNIIQIPRWCVLEWVWLITLSLVVTLALEKVRDYILCGISHGRCRKR